MLAFKRRLDENAVEDESTLLKCRANSWASLLVKPDYLHIAIQSLVRMCKIPTPSIAQSQDTTGKADVSEVWKRGGDRSGNFKFPGWFSPVSGVGNRGVS